MYISKRHILILIFLLKLIIVSIFKDIIVDPLARVYFLTTLSVTVYLFFSPKKLHIDSWIILIVVCLTFYISLQSHPHYSSLYYEIVPLRILSISGGIAGYLIIRQYKVTELYNILKLVSIVLFTYYTLKIIRSFSASAETGDMDLSYGLIIVSVSSLAFALNEKKIFWFIFAGVCLLETLVLGERGPFLCIFTFIIFYIIFLKTQDMKPLKKISIVSSCVITLIILLVNADEIALFLSSRLGFLGANRIVDKLSSGDISDGTGRDVLWLKIIDMIGGEYFHAYGPLADQYYFDFFSHNIVLELALTFGMIPGLIISLSIILFIFYILIPCRKTEEKLVFLIFFSCSIPRLCVSNSFWYDQNFWMMLGIGVSILLFDKSSNTNMARKINIINPQEKKYFL